MGIGEWYIMADESPDIRLSKMSNRRLKEKPFDIVNLEVMTIPAISKNKFDSSQIEKEIIDFIKDKKFNKRYGKFARLIIYLEFHHKDIKLGFLHEIIKKVKSNPFFQFWLFFFSSPDLLRFDIAEIYPNINLITVSRVQDKDLLF